MIAHEERGKDTGIPHYGGEGLCDLCFKHMPKGKIESPFHLVFPSPVTLSCKVGNDAEERGDGDGGYDLRGHSGVGVM